MDTEPKRNYVHIERIKKYRKTLTDLIGEVNEGTNWANLELKVTEFTKEIVGQYNNREMSLVLTKLQESGCWLEEQDIEATVAKLKEARYWAGEYLKTLE